MLITALVLAGCSGFGGSKQPGVTVNPNVYPANYRRQIVTLLSTQLTNAMEYRTTLISQPVLKPVADATDPHYVVCLQYPNCTEHRIKVVIFLDNEPTQYIDATAQQCGDAVYQPFSELATISPSK